MPVFQGLKIVWISKENPILNLIYKNLTLRPQRLILGILKAITEIKSVTMQGKLKNHNVPSGQLSQRPGQHWVLAKRGDDGRQLGGSVAWSRAQQPGHVDSSVAPPPTGCAWPWKRYLSLMGLRSQICKAGIIIWPTLGNVMRINVLREVRGWADVCHVAGTT